MCGLDPTQWSDERLAEDSRRIEQSLRNRGRRDGVADLWAGSPQSGSSPAQRGGEPCKAWWRGGPNHRARSRPLRHGCAVQLPRKRGVIPLTEQNELGIQIPTGRRDVTTRHHSGSAGDLVAPEMVEAGLLALYRHDPRLDTDEDEVTRIFLAMLRAGRPLA